MHISSLQNGRVKNVVKLNNRRQRDAQQLTIVEGVRELGRALQCGIIPHESYICPELLDDAGKQIAEKLPNPFTVTPEIFNKIAYRGQSGGLLITIPYLQQTLNHLPVTHDSFFAVIENVEKPGNLGAILRTADAAGVDGVIVCSDGTATTDIHNPNVIRASLGTLFSIPIATATTEETISWLNKNGFQTVVATPEAEKVYTAVSLTPPIAIITGSEAHGVSRNWLQVANQQVQIPMHGIADSLNLATATALLLYEVVRQRVR